jgi:hypothetical protein
MDSFRHDKPRRLRMGRTVVVAVAWPPRPCPDDKRGLGNTASGNSLDDPRQTAQDNVAQDGQEKVSTVDIAELARRTGIGARRLRYTLDHGVLPGSRKASQGRGAARSFTDFEAFGLACATLMLEAGLRRSLVHDCIHLLCGQHGRSTPVHEIPLYQAFQQCGAVSLEIGDGLNVRIWDGPGVAPSTLERTWRQAETGAILQEGYEPLVLVRINVGHLRRRLTGSAL